MKVNHPVVLKQQPKLPALLEEFNQTKSLCMELLKTPHYQKMGEAGIFAIVQKASSLGINPIEALNGAMYFVQGKVELSAITMAKLIRSKGHSYTLGKESNNTLCVLHGERKDNGDTWKVSFSIEDAKRAEIYKQGGPWSKYPDVMCYNRALSKLARQLFPDIIGNCYVEGEIRDAPPLYDSDPGPSMVDNMENLQLLIDENVSIIPENIVHLSQEEVGEVEELIGDSKERRDNILGLIEDRYNVTKIEQLTQEQKEVLCKGIMRANERKLEEAIA